MAYAVGVAQDGDGGVVHNVLHEGVGAPGNEEVHGLVAFQQFIDFIMLLCLEKAFFRQPCLHRRFMNQGKKNAVGIGGFLSALQDGAVAAFQAEGGNLHQCVGAGFKDDADDADGAGDPGKAEPFIQLPVQGDFPDGIGKGNQAGKLCRYVGKFCFVKGEPLHHRRRHMVFPGQGKILPVCPKNFLFMGIERLPNAGKGFIPLFHRRGGQQRRRQLHLFRFFAYIHREISFLGKWDFILYLHCRGGGGESQ